MPDTDVLIVGAGPVGLTAALELTQSGRRMMIVDAQSEGANTSRAAVVHPRTLELLARYGVSERLVARGVHTPVFTVRDRDRLLLHVPFGDLPTSYPYTLMISQADTEAFLLARLKELGGDVVRPARLVGFRQERDRVVATLDDGREVAASYLLGADGMHSVVREQLGIPFSGGTYGESFSLADVRLSGGLPMNEVILYFSPDGLVVVAPLPDGRHRIVATVDEAPEHPDVQFVQELLGRRGPARRPARVHEVFWGSRFRVHHRIAEHFRAGRVLLAGDAAHVHSPAGGQGMNLGIEDGALAGMALEKALGGDTAALEAYERTRPAVATDVVRLASRLTRLATMGRASRPVRNLGLSVLGHVPAVQRRLAWQLSGLNRRP